MWGTVLFVTGLVLFVGGVHAVRLPPHPTEQPDRVFVTGSAKTPLSYVQTDGAVVGAIGLFVMLGATIP